MISREEREVHLRLLGWYPARVVVDYGIYDGCYGWAHKNHVGRGIDHLGNLFYMAIGSAEPANATTAACYIDRIQLATIYADIIHLAEDL
jgi:hypothetical protein